MTRGNLKLNLDSRLCDVDPLFLTFTKFHIGGEGRQRHVGNGKSLNCIWWVSKLRPLSQKYGILLLYHQIPVTVKAFLLVYIQWKPYSLCPWRTDFLRNTQSEGNVALTEGGTCHRNYIQNKRNWEILNGVSFINPYPAFWLSSYGTFFSLCGFSIVLFQMLSVCLHFFWLTVSILFNMMVRLIHAGWLYPKQEQK